METLIDLGLEVLDGCLHDCFGCQVKKSDSRSITEEEVQKLIGFLNEVRDKANNKQTFGILAIGPTDFVMSHNSEEVFKTLKPLMDMFDVIELSSTMTYKTDLLKPRLEVLKPYLNGKQLFITVPLNPNNYRNKTFHRLVDNNLKTVFKVFDESTAYNYAYQINVVSYLEGKQNPVIDVKVDELPGMVREITIVIPDGRSDLNELNNRLNFRSSVKALRTLHNEFYQGNDTDPSSMGLFYSEGLLDGHTYMVKNCKRVKCYDVDLIYSKGRLYAPSFYGEDVVILHDDFSVPFTGSETDLTSLEVGMLNQQLVSMDDECSSCRFSNLCLKNGTVLLKNKFMAGECPLPRDNMRTYMPVVLSKKTTKA